MLQPPTTTERSTAPTPRRIPEVDVLRMLAEVFDPRLLPDEHRDQLEAMGRTDARKPRRRWGQ